MAGRRLFFPRGLIFNLFDLHAATTFFLPPEQPFDESLFLVSDIFPFLLDFNHLDIESDQTNNLTIHGKSSRITL